MHKVYENNDIMMYFKKRHCHCCGNTLITKKTKRIVKKGDQDHNGYCNIGRAYHPYGDILVIGRDYYCPTCKRIFSCDEQAEIIDAQKYYNRHIVTENEILFVKSNKISKSIIKVNKFKWFLLIPVVGSFICLFYISNGRLNEKMHKHDGYILTFTPLIIVIALALIMKLLFTLIGMHGDSNDYQNIIIIIACLLSFNLTMLWYINHRFK